MRKDRDQVRVEVADDGVGGAEVVAWLEGVPAARGQRVTITITSSIRWFRRLF